MLIISIEISIKKKKTKTKETKKVAIRLTYECPPPPKQPQTNLCKLQKKRWAKRYNSIETPTQSLRSLKKMLKSSLSIDDIGEDLIQNVLCRLPAQSFASAACVSRFWNSICNRILFSSPKLSSAISFNPLLEVM